MLLGSGPYYVLFLTAIAFLMPYGLGKVTVKPSRFSPCFRADYSIHPPI
jgi:hypothetical protein